MGYFCISEGKYLRLFYDLLYNIYYRLTTLSPVIVAPLAAPLTAPLMACLVARLIACLATGLIELIVYGYAEKIGFLYGIGDVISQPSLLLL